MTKSKPQLEAASIRESVKNQKRAAYQEAIIQAASTVFSRLGFNDTKMTDIAAEAGVSVGTLYNYFKNKEAVINLLKQHENEAFHARIASVNSDLDPVERIRQFIDVTFRFVEERGALLAMAFQSGLYQEDCLAEKMGHGKHETHLFMLHLYEEALTQAMEKGSLRKDLPTDRLALALDGIMSALVFDWVRKGREYSLDVLSTFVFDLFMKGARAR